MFKKTFIKIWNEYFSPVFLGALISSIFLVPATLVLWNFFDLPYWPWKYHVLFGIFFGQHLSFCIDLAGDILSAINARKA